MLRPLLLSVLFAACALPDAAQAGLRALLVGVSDYHSLDADLRGPRNDVRLMAETLIARGADPGRIVVLAAPDAVLPQGVAPAADPTRAAILGGLDALAASAAAGDTVVFYFSGHGSQAPDLSGDEAGGYDEILLPSDAAGWKGAIGAVENAVIDDELGERMQAILDTGAELVAILDACHSATGFRAAGGAGEARYVAPEALGIPAGVEAAAGGHVAPPLTGSFVFLYSSQSDERSFEYPLGDPADPANWYGDFTRNLASALTGIDALTWSQALALAADGLRQEQAAQTPDGEGTLLAAPVFGAGGAAERLRIENGTLRAGLLNGLSEGAVLAVYAGAAGGEPIAEVRIASLTANEARLDAGGLPATAYAEVLAPGTPPAVRVGPPVVAAPGDHAGALAILTRLARDDLVDGVVWSDEGYDIRIVLDGPDIAVVGRDGVLDPAGPGTSPRIPALSEEDVILGFIERGAYVARLRGTLAAAAGKGGLGLPGAGLGVSAELLGEAATGEGCGEPGAEAQPLADGGAVRNCDQVWLALRNGSTTAQDVTVLYIDREFRVEPIWPPAGQSNRIAFGETAEVGLLIDNAAQSAGAEEIVVIAVPARDGAMRTDLSGLAGAAPTRKAGAASATEDWLTAAAMPTRTRALGLPGRPEPIKVTRLGVMLTPALK